MEERAFIVNRAYVENVIVHKTNSCFRVDDVFEGPVIFIIGQFNIDIGLLFLYPGIVDEIKRIDPELSKIILFGSLATDSVRSEDFDIDLAVSSERIFKIAAWSEDQDLPLDVVDLDALSPDFRRVVEEEGTVLYEKAL